MKGNRLYLLKPCCSNLIANLKMYIFCAEGEVTLGGFHIVMVYDLDNNDRVSDGLVTFLWGVNKDDKLLIF
jgi:hypothetical protein